jgi:hypothetical protein
VLTDGSYQIAWDCRDIGYGPEEGSRQFTYRGPASWGKHEFTPDSGGPPVYLFPDEITDAR